MKVRNRNIYDVAEKNELNKKVLSVQVNISVDEAQVHHSGQKIKYVKKSNIAAGKPEVLIT